MFFDAIFPKNSILLLWFWLRKNSNWNEFFELKWNSRIRMIPTKTIHKNRQTLVKSDPWGKKHNSKVGAWFL